MDTDKDDPHGRYHEPSHLNFCIPVAVFLHGYIPMSLTRDKHGDHELAGSSLSPSKLLPYVASHQEQTRVRQKENRSE